MEEVVADTFIALWEAAERIDYEKLSILRPRSHSIRYREPSIPNVRATCIKKAFRC
ncbi:hypothetical protein I5Q83_01575 [Enterocloster clostridioformis]|nr:hypothetical protein [Enterocloster clostridioformis]QQR01161.1 hypothetical protein I5Q83_01575 [Enterocloster clostridioformis]